MYRRIQTIHYIHKKCTGERHDTRPETERRRGFFSISYVCNIKTTCLMLAIPILLVTLLLLYNYYICSMWYTTYIQTYCKQLYYVYDIISKISKQAYTKLFTHIAWYGVCVCVSAYTQQIHMYSTTHTHRERVCAHQVQNIYIYNTQRRQSSNWPYANRYPILSIIKL